MKHLYNLPQELRQKANIDVEKIDGYDIKCLDDYLLYFPMSRVIVYNYLKYADTSTSVKISWLHKVFGTDIGSWSSCEWRQSLLQTDKAYKKTIDKNVLDDYSWSTGSAIFAAMHFDNKRLNIPEIRTSACKLTEKVIDETIKHWSCDLTDLQNPSSYKYNSYQKERLTLLDNFWQDLLGFLDMSNVDYTYFFDRIEFIIDQKYTLRIILLYGKYIRIDVMSNTGHLQLNDQNLVLVKYISKNPIISTIIERLEDNFDKTRKFRDDMIQLEETYKSEFDQYRIIMNSVLSDLKSEHSKSYFDSRRIKFLAINDHAITTYIIYFRPNGKPQYKRSTYLIDRDSGEITKSFENHMNTSFYVTDINELSDNLLRSGFVNVYAESDNINMFDYVELLTGCTDLFHKMFFRYTYSDLSAVSEQYFDTYQDDIIKCYLNDQHSTYEETQKYVDREFKDVKKLKFMNYFENRYAELNPAKYDDNKLKFKRQQLMYAKQDVANFISDKPHLQFLKAKL